MTRWPTCIIHSIYLLKTGKREELDIVQHLLGLLRIKHFITSLSVIYPSKLDSIRSTDQKLRNFSGLFKGPQSPLYLRNAEVLSQASHATSLGFQLFKTSGLQFDKWLFRPEKFSGVWRNMFQGSVSRKSREPFGPDKPIVKLQSACFENMIS